MDECLRGGIRFRGPRPILSVSALNTTSVMLHWRSLLGISSDFLLLTETRATSTEQAIVTKALSQKSWGSSWGPPVVVRPPGGMTGRSGGTAVCAQPPWQMVREFPVECEAPKHHYQVNLYQNVVSGAEILVGVYYGHPDLKEVTVRDLARLGEVLRASSLAYVLGGDVNIDDLDELQPDDSGLLIDTPTSCKGLRKTTRTNASCWSSSTKN